MMRNGVSDLYRRCEVSDQCNNRYGDSLAMAQVDEKLKEVVSTACNKITKKGKRYRGFNPWRKEDYKLLTFLAKGENAINGFRNHHLRKCLVNSSILLCRPCPDKGSLGNEQAGINSSSILVSRSSSG